jgi:hypothetical protein
MAAKKKHPVAKIHRRWGRKPLEKPHSTPKGRKGYDRRTERNAQRDQADEL